MQTFYSLSQVPWPEIFIQDNRVNNSGANFVARLINTVLAMESNTLLLTVCLYNKRLKICLNYLRVLVVV